MQEEVKRWLDQAEEEFETAKINFNAKKNISPQLSGVNKQLRNLLKLY